MDSSESSPLLSSEITPTSIASPDTENCSSRPVKPPWARIVVLLLLFLVFLDLGYELITPAQTRVFEQILCSLYYRSDPDPVKSGGRDGAEEKWCKVAPIQGGVAAVKGWQLTFDSVGMLIFSVPWAYVADFYGRNPVLLLDSAALFGKYVFVQFICYLQGDISLNWTWLSALHTAFGGSVTVVTALIYTIISDVVPEEKRAALMTWNPWIPMLLGLAIELAAIATLLFIPETKNYNATDPLGLVSPPTSTDDPRPRLKPWQGVAWHTRHFLSFLFSDRRIPLILSTFTVHMLFLNRDVLLQYISTRYSISLAQATAIISIRSGAVIFICVVLLPALSIYCRNRVGPNRSDLFLARISAVIIVLTFLGIGLAPSLPGLIPALTLNALGWGLWSFLRSLLTSLIEA
ncbi:uncharacterized protein PG998_010489 [Apiospora kogelbergensis]|uniref:uncharacterized protein n=1 Tax=Apiospora kogelbergensis TaxID=1337665 RepID=UPI003131FA36